LDGQADRALANAVFRREAVHGPVFPQVFQGTIPLVFGRQFRRFAAFLLKRYLIKYTIRYSIKKWRYYEYKLFVV
jgi:hypothetical protein